ncbi:hypothetical protein ABZ565_34215 [Streptomyces sp. NPDC016469]|uniref:hypothetical protein n=1 Tax=Streptomyces sp. NPDC016469 TaxID=3157191 RepID=UPI0033EB2AC1
MPEIVRLQPEKSDGYLPPMCYIKFSQEEFPTFLANPTGTLRDLGFAVNNVSVVVKDHVWDGRKQTWITDQDDPVVRDLPTSSSWGWVCGYQDEQCVCERVLM